MKVEGRTRRVHRVAWEQRHGPIPPGLEPDHLCRQPDCFEDSHLELVTHAENNRRSDSVTALKARQTHCKREHPLEGANLILSERTRGERTYRMRECRQCRADRQRARRAA
jgi:hypothetical protein